MSFWSAFKMRLAGLTALKDSNDRLYDAVRAEMAEAIAQATKITLIEMGHLEKESLH